MSLTKKLTDKPPEWNHETWTARLNTAASCLVLWGVMTEAERMKVHGRLLRMARKQNAIPAWQPPNKK